MLNKLHVSLTGRDLAADGSTGLTKTILDGINLQAEQLPVDDPDWSIGMRETLRMVKGVEEGSHKAKYLTLYYIRQSWEELPKEFREEYDQNFDVFSFRELDVLPETRDNYLRAIETFFVKGAAPFEYVPVSKLDERGKVVMEDGKPVMDYVKFDPVSATMSKLMAARPLVEAGKATTKVWGMLMDPKVTTPTFHAEVYSPVSETHKGEDPTLYFTIEGDYLIAHEYGKEALIGQLYLDSKDLGERGVSHILKLLNIKRDEEVLLRAGEQVKQTRILEAHRVNGESNGNHYGVEGSQAEAEAEL